jgi:peptidoglycan/LPS O-acetylase OafA/YrhL
MVWPLVIFFCQPRTLKRLCIGLLAGALVLRMVFLSLNFESVHVAVAGLTPCRFDGIALGSLLALLVRERGIAGIRTTLMPYVPWVAAVSVLVIAVACARHRTTIWSGAPGQTFGYSFVAILCSCVFLWALTSTENQWVGWIFTRPWLRFFGRYSYALYLFHLPVSRFVQDYVYGRPQLLQFHGSRIPGVIIFSLISGAISLVLALLSWNLVEKHFLALKRYFPKHSKVKPVISTPPAVLVDDDDLEDFPAIA